MATTGMRASDTDRQQAADLLAEHVAAGRLTIGEYDQRVSKAYGAVYQQDFQPLFTDLPSGRGGYAGPGTPDESSDGGRFAGSPFAGSPFTGGPFAQGPFGRVPFGGLTFGAGSNVGKTVRGGLRSAGRLHPAVLVLGVIAMFLAIGVLVHLLWPLLVLAAIIFFFRGGPHRRYRSEYRAQRRDRRRN